MNRRVTTLLVGALAIGVAGCGLFRGREDEGRVKRVLGVDDERFREVDLENLDDTLAKPQNGIKLTIQLDKAEYKVGEPIVADVRIENVGTGTGAERPRDIPVYFEPLAQTPGGAMVEWQLKFRIRSESTQKLVYRSPEVKVAEADRVNYYHFVTLPPHSFIGRRFVFWPTRARALMTSGRYSLVASYEVGNEYPYVILNRNFTASQVKLLGTKLAYTRVWTGRVHSNRVDFRIKRKKRFIFF